MPRRPPRRNHPIFLHHRSPTHRLFSSQARLYNPVVVTIASLTPTLHETMPKVSAPPKSLRPVDPPEAAQVPQIRRRSAVLSQRHKMQSEPEQPRTQAFPKPRNCAIAPQVSKPSSFRRVPRMRSVSARSEPSGEIDEQAFVRSRLCASKEPRTNLAAVAPHVRRTESQSHKRQPFGRSFVVCAAGTRRVLAGSTPGDWQAKQRVPEEWAVVVDPRKTFLLLSVSLPSTNEECK